MEPQVRVVADENGAVWRISRYAGPEGREPSGGVLWLAAEAVGRAPLVIVAHGDSLDTLADDELRAAIRLGRISGEVPERRPPGRERPGTLLWLLAGAAVVSVPLLRRWLRGRWSMRLAAS